MLFFLNLGTNWNNKCLVVLSIAFVHWRLPLKLTITWFNSEYSNSLELTSKLTKRWKLVWKVVIFILRCVFLTLKVDTNKTTTLHQTICTWIALENYDNNDQQFNSHGFLIKFSLIIWYIDFVMTTYILNVDVC